MVVYLDWEEGKMLFHMECKDDFIIFLMKQWKEIDIWERVVALGLQIIKSFKRC